MEVNQQDRLFSDGQHQADTTCSGHGGEARFYVQTQIIAYIESFQVSIYGSISHIQSPEDDEK